MCSVDFGKHGRRSVYLSIWKKRDMRIGVYYVVLLCPPIQPFQMPPFLPPATVTSPYLIGYSLISVVLAPGSLSQAILARNLLWGSPAITARTAEVIFIKADIAIVPFSYTQDWGGRD